jgi:hypothetical protein
MKGTQRLRVLAAGGVSAIVLFVGAGIVNGAVLGAEWNAWVMALGTVSHAPSNAVGMVLWLVLSLVLGVAGAWVHVAVRPRYETRRRAALVAAVWLWASGFLAPAIGQLALGAIPSKIIIVDCAGGAASAVLAMLAGAAVYRD